MFNITRYSIPHGINDGEHTIKVQALQSLLLPGDTVFLLQQSFNLTAQAGVVYWFLSTEGGDKYHMVDAAIDRGFRWVIDYSSFNLARHLQHGAEVGLWLPIAYPPSPIFRSSEQNLHGQWGEYKTQKSVLRLSTKCYQTAWNISKCF